MFRGTLDSFGDLSLMCSAVTGDSARNNLAAFGNKKAQCPWLFVVDRQILFCTETADFTALKRASFARSARSAGARTLSRAAGWTLTGSTCRTLIGVEDVAGLSSLMSISPSGNYSAVSSAAGVSSTPLLPLRLPAFRPFSPARQHAREGR